MPMLSRPIRQAALALALLAPGVARADDPPSKPEARKAAEAIKPLPPVAIPDDPPPHEGAMIDIPYVIEPPDILIVEVLEALPGRPITGERLVKPDGTVSLGFYGDVHVRGLTIQQAKTKVIHHLKEYLSDEILGLTRFQEAAEVEIPKDPPGGLPEGGKRVPSKPATAPEAPPGGKPEAPPEDRSAARRDAADGSGRVDREERGSASRRRGPMRRIRRAVQALADPGPVAPTPGGESRGGLVAIAPADSTRVFVDFGSLHSKVYYVQGDVGVPGRLPSVGNETVLDALNYAGGMIPTAEPRDVHLYRPARGGKPARDYAIDLDAIRRGDPKANLQMFPGDRLVVGRNPTVTKTIEIDRAAAPIHSALNAMLQYSFTARSLANLGMPNPAPNPQPRGDGPAPPPAVEVVPMPPAQRDAMIKEWVDFLWSISSKEGGAMLDEKAFREAVLRKLGPAPEPRK